MKSEKGLGLVSLVIMIIVLMLLTGVSTYVAMTSDVFSKSDEKITENTTNQIETNVTE